MDLSALPPDLQEAGQEFSEKYPAAFDELLIEGRPRAMVNAFLWIDAKASQEVVRFEYNVNQDFVDPLIYLGGAMWDEVGFGKVILKDRQATMTSKVQGDGFVVVISLPGTQVVHVFQDEDTGKQLTERLKLFWDRLNPFLLDHDGVKVVKVGDARNELRVEFWEGTKLIGKSSYLVVSAGSREFGAGITPNFVIYDEYDLFPNYDLVGRINAAKGPNCKTIKLSTPRGMGQLYEDYTAAKEGRSGETAIAIYWFQNPLNALNEGNQHSAPAFNYDFEFLPEHLYIMESSEWAERSVHKGDPLRAFRWWEWKRQEIRQILANKGIHDESRLLGEMEMEHCSNDSDCFSNFGKTPFDPIVRQDYQKWSKDMEEKGVRERRTLAPGLELIVYVPPETGMVYACGMDCSEGGKLGDAISAPIKDATGKYVAAIYGRCDLAVATRAIVKVLRGNGIDSVGYATVMEPLFAPEVDGGLGLFVIEEAKRAGYTNFWKTPPKEGEDEEKYHARRDKYGWRTQGNKETMKQIGVAKFNGRHVLLWDLGLLRDMANFAPDTERHTADRLMAYFITEAITDPDHPKKFGRQWVGMCLKVRLLTPGMPQGPPTPKPKKWVDVHRTVPTGPGIWGRH